MHDKTVFGASFFYCSKKQRVRVSVAYRIESFGVWALFSLWIYIVIIVVPAIRQCASWGSTLITHKHSREKKKTTATKETCPQSLTNSLLLIVWIHLFDCFSEAITMYGTFDISYRTRFALHLLRASPSFLCRYPTDLMIKVATYYRYRTSKSYISTRFFMSLNRVLIYH